jgi:hypothetical protein
MGENVKQPNNSRMDDVRLVANVFLEPVQGESGKNAF